MSWNYKENFFVSHFWEIPRVIPNNRALLSQIFLGNTLWQADLRYESGPSFLGSVLHIDIYSDPQIKFIGFNLLQQVIPV